MYLEKEIQKYLKKQKRHNLKKGEAVKVMRSAKSHEQGWGNTWVDEMDDAVGKIGQVVDVRDELGIRLRFDISTPANDYRYPHFVLRRVSKKEE